MKLNCPGLHTQNPGLRVVYLEPSPKTSSDKINMFRQRRKTREKRSCITQPGLTNQNPALKEINLEPSTKKPNDSAKALVSPY